MFCSKCGKEIADEAVICPQCGCATANYHQPPVTHNAEPQNNSVYSQDYIALKEFEENVNSLYASSIVALVLFMGIGVIFSILTWLKAKNLVIPEITTTNPNEIAMFESLKRKVKKSVAVCQCTFVCTVDCLGSGIAYWRIVRCCDFGFCCVYLHCVLGRHALHKTLKQRYL